MMKTFSESLRFLFVVGAALCAVPSFTLADEARFFRVAGPVPTTITAVSVDGYVTWTNQATNATFTIQTAVSLLSETNWVDYVQVPATNEVTTEQLYDPNPPSGMALIPAGSFTMGDTLDGESDATPPTNVYVSAFYMDTNLVSYSQWQTVYNWATNNGYAFDHPGLGKATNHPAQTVDWWDMVKWCNARSEMAGLMPAYYTDWTQAAVYRTGDLNLSSDCVNWAASGYRLPTEAEWEKAARGGLSGQRFPWGDTISESQADYVSYWVGGLPYYSYDVNTYSGPSTNYDTGGVPYTSPVGSFPANGYGLNDMAGNLWEGCWDWYAGPPYRAGSPYAGGSDPRGPPSSPYGERVLRGGFWGATALGVRCANRYWIVPSVTLAGANNNTGFRCVRGL